MVRVQAPPMRSAMATRSPSTARRGRPKRRHSAWHKAAATLSYRTHLVLSQWEHECTMNGAGAAQSGTRSHNHLFDHTKLAQKPAWGSQCRARTAPRPHSRSPMGCESCLAARAASVQSTHSSNAAQGRRRGPECSSGAVEVPGRWGPLKGRVCGTRNVPHAPAHGPVEL